MKFICLIIIVYIVLIGIYCAGVTVGKEQEKRLCAEYYADNQIQIIKIQEKINAETFNRGVADIRDVLRKKYTIAE